MNIYLKFYQEINYEDMINNISSRSKFVTKNKLPWLNVEYDAGAGEGCLHVQS